MLGSSRWAYACVGGALVGRQRRLECSAPYRRQRRNAHLHRVDGDLDNACYWQARRPQATGDLATEWATIAATLFRTSRSLYKRANGYNYDTVKIFMPAGAKQPVVVHYVEHNWRDVQNVDHVLGKYIISDRPMTEEQWAAERATIIDEKVAEELPAPRSKYGLLVDTPPLPASPTLPRTAPGK